MSTACAREIKPEKHFVITGRLVLVGEKIGGEVRVRDVVNRIDATNPQKAAETAKRKIIDLLMGSPVVKSARVALAVWLYVWVNLYRLTASEARSLAKQGLVVKRAGSLYSVYEKEVYEVARDIVSVSGRQISIPAIAVNRRGVGTLVGDGVDAAVVGFQCDGYYIEEFPLTKGNDGKLEAVVEIAKEPWIGEPPRDVDLRILGAREVENASFRTLESLVEKLAGEFLAYPVTRARIVTRLAVEEQGDRCSSVKCAPKAVTVEIDSTIRVKAKKARKVFWCSMEDFQRPAGAVFE